VTPTILSGHQLTLR